MIQWLSDYKFDFILAAIPLQIILLVFYGSRRNLPIRQSVSFLIVMISNLIMTASDIAACELGAIWTHIPASVLYIVNIIYFAALVCISWSLFDYTAEVCSMFTVSGRLGQILSALPAVIMELLILTSPWTGAVFRISGTDGYQSGNLYSLIYYCMWFYILFSVFTVFLRWKYIGVRVKSGLLGYNAVLLAGTLLRKAFPHTLVMPYFSVLAIFLIYIISQNPDLYRDHQTRLFNQDAFHVIGREYISKNFPFHCIVIAAHNYDSAKVVFGISRMKRYIQLTGQWMISHFSGYYVFYFGNGNFLLLRRGTMEENREQAARDIKERLEHSQADIGTEVSLSMSVMVIPYKVIPREINRVEDLLRFTISNACAENNQGNMIIRQEMLQILNRKENIEYALGKALEEHRLEAYFQPIYSVHDRRIVGAEALARLKDPELGFIPPSEFIPIAEKTGDIMELGRQVFEKVCQFAQSAPLSVLGLEFINVNLSPAQCMDDRLAEQLSLIAMKHQVPMERLDFEITETSISDYAMIKKQMLSLQERGAELSLDDFGAGMSNLNSLIQLPIHIVKIDMDVVRSYFRGETQVLPDLVRLFQKANMKIVAEGVETEEMKNILIEMGCDFLQGYYFSCPLPPEEFLEFLRRQS